MGVKNTHFYLVCLEKYSKEKSIYSVRREPEDIILQVSNTSANIKFLIDTLTLQLPFLKTINLEARDRDFNLIDCEMLLFEELKHFFIVEEQTEQGQLVNYSCTIRDIYRNFTFLEFLSCSLYYLTDSKNPENNHLYHYSSQLRRTRRLSYFCGANVSFIIENWVKLLFECRLAYNLHQLKLDYKASRELPITSLHLNYLKFCFKLESQIPICHIPFNDNLVSNLLNIEDFVRVVEVDVISYQYTRMLQILTNHSLSEKAGSESTLKISVVYPMFEVLFKQYEGLRFGAEYDASKVFQGDRRLIDLVACPCKSGTEYPPLFIIACSGIEKKMEQDHKDSPRVFEISLAIISRYIGIYEEFYGESNYLTKIESLKVFGCVTDRLKFQFFVCYPRLLGPQSNLKYEVIYEAPKSWELDFDLESNECLTPNLFLETQAELGFVQMELSLNANDNLEPDLCPPKFSVSKKRKLNTIEIYNKLIPKLQFIKNFVNLAHQSMLDLPDLSFESENILKIHEDQRVSNARSSHMTDTGKKNKDNIDGEDPPKTPSKTVTAHGRKYCVVEKKLGRFELQILNYLKSVSNQNICQFYHSCAAESKFETKLYFEPLIAFNDNLYQSLPELENASFNYVLNMTDALKFLKEIGIYHRDISPNNILVSHPNSKYENFKLIDFGHSIFKLKYKVDGSSFGTPGFVAKCLVKDSSIPFSHEHDLESLGLCLKQSILLPLKSRCRLISTKLTRSIDVMDNIYSKMTGTFFLSNKFADLHEIFDFTYDKYRLFLKTIDFVHTNYFIDT
eukprot:NODE_137_length_16306_cov_0.462640.p1 type:complete len:791 gc:universal NODE_137_length_16306_cov_0.462640:10329-7957(-)